MVKKIKTVLVRKHYLIKKIWKKIHYIYQNVLGTLHI